MVRRGGIEPPTQTPKVCMLPLHYPLKDSKNDWHPLLAKARRFLLWLAKYCGYHFAILPKFVPRFGLLPHYTTSRLTFILVCLLFIVVTIINSWCPVMVTLHRISLIRGVLYYWINRTLFVLVYHSFLTSFLRKAIIFALTEPYDVCRIIW